MSGSGWDAVSVVQVWSEDTSGCLVVVVVSPGCPGEVGRPSWMSGNGQEALPDIREWSGVPLGCPGVVEGTYG